MGHIAINGNKPVVTVGSHVRVKGSEDYLGKVVKEEFIRLLVVEDREGKQVTVHPFILEIAPKLTPDEAWVELPYLILGQINKFAAWGNDTIYPGEQSAIRHEAYKLLGGAGITVDESIKARVRKTIQRIALAMGVELA